MAQVQNIVRVFADLALVPEVLMAFVDDAAAVPDELVAAVIDVAEEVFVVELGACELVIVEDITDVELDTVAAIVPAATKIALEMVVMELPALEVAESEPT